MEHLEAAGLATFPKSRSSFSLYLCFLLRILYTTTIRNSSSLLLSSFFVFLVLERRAAAHTETLWWCRITLFYFGEDQNDI